MTDRFPLSASESVGAVASIRHICGGSVSAVIHRTASEKRWDDPGPVYSLTSDQASYLSVCAPSHKYPAYNGGEFDERGKFQPPVELEGFAPTRAQLDAWKNEYCSKNARGEWTFKKSKAVRLDIAHSHLNKAKALLGAKSNEELLSPADISEAGSRETTSAKSAKHARNIVSTARAKLIRGEFGTARDSAEHPNEDRLIDVENPLGSGRIVRVRVNLENQKLKEFGVFYESILNPRFDKKGAIQSLGVEDRKMSDALYRINQKADEAHAKLTAGDSLMALLMADDLKWNAEWETLWSQGGIAIVVHYKVPQIYVIDAPIVEGFEIDATGEHESAFGKDWLEIYVAARRHVIHKKYLEVAHKAGRRAALKARGKKNKADAYRTAVMRVRDEFERADYYDLPPIQSVLRPRTVREGLLSGLGHAA